MKPFNAARLCLEGGRLAQDLTMLIGGHNYSFLTPTAILTRLEASKVIAVELGLTSVDDQLERIKRDFTNPQVNLSQDEIYTYLRALNDRMTDDLKRITFGFIPRDKVEYFESLDFGKPFADRFKNLPPEVKAAGTCYAHELNTACVFHLMRVMESGVRYFGKRCGVQITFVSRKNNYTELTWKQILSSVDTELKAMPQTNSRQKNRHDTLSGIRAHLGSVADAWRNTTMHPSANYEAVDAFAIIHHVRSFMTALAVL
jgi:hypothetical protein